MRKPGYLAAYSKARGISHVAMRKLLIRAGVNYLEPFDWKVVDRLLDAGRHLARDSYRLRKVIHPYV
jgi:hypothetical protein